MKKATDPAPSGTYSTGDARGLQSLPDFPSGKQFLANLSSEKSSESIESILLLLMILLAGFPAARHAAKLTQWLHLDMNEFAKFDKERKGGFIGNA